jgi:HK97 family phage major capsid protein
MKSLELKRQKEDLKAERNILANKGELTDAEKLRWTETETINDNLEREIRIEEQRENYVRLQAAEKGNDVSRREEKDFAKYSIVKAIREFVDGRRITGLEAEMHEEAKLENSFAGGVTGLGISERILNTPLIKVRSTLAAGSSPVVATIPMGFIDAVYAKVLLVELGAKTMSGLTSNVDLPYMSTAPATEWLPENEESVDANAALNKYSLTPKRIANFVPLSKLLLMQSSVGIEQIIWNHLISATAVKLQGGAIAGGTHACTGLLNTSIGSVVGGDNGAAPTHANVLALIKEVAIDNCDYGALAFLCSPSVRWKLQSTAIESGHPERVWNPIVQDQLLGFRAGVTSLVPDNLTKGNQSQVCSAIIFGNWNEMTIGQFGAIDLTVDNLTKAKEYLVNLIINAFYDVAITRPDAFAAMKDAKCAS